MFAVLQELLWHTTSDSMCITSLSVYNPLIRSGVDIIKHIWIYTGYSRLFVCWIFDSCQWKPSCQLTILLTVIWPSSHSRFIHLLQHQSYLLTVYNTAFPLCLVILFAGGQLTVVHFAHSCLDNQSAIMQNNIIGHFLCLSDFYMLKMNINNVFSKISH